MELYGLLGFTHGGARVITVMCSAGVEAGLAAVGAVEDLGVASRDGSLTRYQEKRDGAIRRLVSAHGVVILSKAEWDAKKHDLGEAIR